jgi:hypothetical protein
VKNLNDNLSNLNFQNFNQSIGKNNKSKDKHNKNVNIDPKLNKKDFEDEDEDI